MLKSDFHMHAGTDDHHKLGYSYIELIDYASEQGYEVMAITNHNTVVYSKTLKDHAKKKGILLIPGVELEIEGKETILLNVKVDVVKKVKTFDDLRKYKKKHNIVVMAPHPYFPHYRSLHGKLKKNIDLFDAIEYSHYYLSWLNFNKRGEKIAKKNDLAILGTSDCHSFSQINHTYTMVESKKDINSVLDAIRKRRTRLMTEPFPIYKMIKVLYWLFFR